MVVLGRNEEYFALLGTSIYDLLFWKSALIMTSRYLWERAEVDRKKRRAADTTISVSMYL
jgi:hypothetical protein